MNKITTGIKHTCHYCQSVLEKSPNNPALLNGFLDMSMRRIVCNNCCDKHNAEKELQYKNGEISNG